jgi:non-heme chloroperoxidase
MLRPLLPVLAAALPLHFLQAQPALPADPSPHQVHTVSVAPDVRLEVLDWGGAGVPIVFLPGAGNTAHVFDDLAPRFTDGFRVYGITRRGYGISSRPDDGYDPATRAADVIAVLDSLGLREVILAGHSVAGDEISRVAIEQPGRVRALVYVDAMDHGPDFLEMLQAGPRVPTTPIEMTAADSASFAAFMDFRERENGVRYPPGEGMGQALFDDDGRFEGYRPRADAQVAGTLGQAELSRIQVPALAIWARFDSAEEFYEKEWPALDEEGRTLARQSFENFAAWMSRARARFHSEVPRFTAVYLPRAHHYLFITQADEVERLMRVFLAGAADCARPLTTAAPGSGRLAVR